VNNNYGNDNNNSNNNDSNNEISVELNDIKARNSNNSSVLYNDNKTTSICIDKYQLNPLHVKDHDLI
jgi:hypothetical protein